jgi:hypothetical protein
MWLAVWLDAAEERRIGTRREGRRGRQRQRWVNATGGGGGVGASPGVGGVHNWSLARRRTRREYAWRGVSRSHGATGVLRDGPSPMAGIWHVVGALVYVGTQWSDSNHKYQAVQ